MKTVVVAGAAKAGIGEAVTRRIISEGIKVIGTYQPEDVGEAQKLMDEFKNTGMLELHEVDHTSNVALMNFCNEITDELSGLVYAEFFFYLEDVEEFDYNLFETSFKINVFAPNLMIRELIKKMGSEASIVMILSVEAFRGSFGASAYAAAQAAKQNLVSTFANVFTERFGVRINSVGAGWIGGVMDTDDTFNKTKSMIPIKRLGSPDEIADDVFLMLTRHKYTTGTTLISDGGYLCVDVQSKTEDLESGKYYKLLVSLIKKAEPGSKIWAVSMMLQNEWDSTQEEIEFMDLNLEAVRRGVCLERVFVIDEETKEKVRQLEPIRMHMQNEGEYLNALAVEKKCLKENYLAVYNKLGEGFIAFDKQAALIDMSENSARGYLTMNKTEIEKMSKTFEELKKQAIKLSEFLGYEK